MSRHLADLTPYAEHHGWCDAQLIDTHLDETLRQRRVRTELTADALRVIFLHIGPIAVPL